MITREFNLYLHAGHSIPLVINCNQYDRGEQWLFTLFNADGTQYTPSSGAIVGIKSDNLGIINSGSVDSDGRVVINETQQMTAAVGKAVFELLIDDQTHGTANFIVLVEPKPGDNADLSESDLSLIQQAIDGTSAAAIAQGVSDWMDENLTPTTPVVDQSLTVQGAAADSAKVGQELSDLMSQISSLGGGVPTSVRQAMATLLNSAFYNTDDLSDEKAVIQAWASAITAIALNQSTISINGAGTYQLVATTTPSGGTVSWSSSNTAVATVSSSGLVTSVSNGIATITATSGSVSATCTVTVSGFATLSSISADYTQGTVDTATPLDSLKDDLVVTANWSDSTTSTVASADYTLSGTLTVGTSVITVSYGDKTTTFNVTVTQHVINGWYYPFNGSLTSEGTEDFGFTGTANYTTGRNGTEQAYCHKVETEGDSSTGVLGIKATGMTDYPDLSGNFTISFWHKSFTNYQGHPFTLSKYIGTQTATAIIQSSVTDAGNGWTCDGSTRATKKYVGVTWWWYQGQLIVGLHSSSSSSGNGNSTQFKFTPPTGFSTLSWHHYALTRDGNNIYFFVDGVLQTTIVSTYPLYSSNQIAIGGLFNQNATDPTGVMASGYGDAVQDLYVAETCKWTSSFDPENIVY